MSIAKVKACVGDTPFMKVPQAQRIQNLMRDFQLHDVLELGVMHGVSTCYLADVADHVTAIDLDKPGEDRPAERFLTMLGLRDKVDLFYEPTSYTWRLMKMLDEDPTPRFDLVYIDGAHDWFTDGFAFFLADRLLRPNGWIVFDDLPWTFATSPACAASSLEAGMPDDERRTPQVQKVFDLLVRTHRGYDEFRVEGAWGYAHKLLIPSLDSGSIRVVREVEIREVKVGLGAVARKAARKLAHSR